MKRRDGRAWMSIRVTCSAAFAVFSASGKNLPRRGLGILHEALSTKHLPMNEADTKAGCRPALIGVCSDENSSFLRGSAGAPPLIRAALFSDAANMWSESGVDLGTDGTFFDAGDIKPSSAEDIENA